MGVVEIRLPLRQGLQTVHHTTVVAICRRGDKAARRVSDGSLEHGVHVVTDGKEEAVGHGYASLRPADDSCEPELGAEPRGKDSTASEKQGGASHPHVQDESQGVQAEMQINTSKSVSFAQ